MAYVIMPQELEPICDTFRRLLDEDMDQRVFSHVELLTPKAMLPSYADALDELDLWHQLNIWSNAPAAVRTRTHTTQDLIDAINASDKTHKLVHKYLVSSCDPNIRENVANTLENGPNERFISIMETLRETYRLDRI